MGCTPESLWGSAQAAASLYAYLLVWQIEGTEVQEAMLSKGKERVRDHWTCLQETSQDGTGVWALSPPVGRRQVQGPLNLEDEDSSAGRPGPGPRSSTIEW